jgi:hypothetical protein
VGIGRQRTRLRNQVHAILLGNLLPHCPGADLFGDNGRGWLGEQSLPDDERGAMADSPRVPWRLRRWERWSRCQDVEASYAQPASTSNL